MYRQALLPFVEQKACTMDNFFSGTNTTLLSYLRSAVDELYMRADANADRTHLMPDNETTRLSFIWGPTGCGKSHLLKAVSDYAEQQQLVSYYLTSNQQIPHRLLDMSQRHTVLCIDDVDDVMPLQQEHYWFDLINQAKELDACHLIFAAKSSPQMLECQLPDLKSRMQWCTPFKLNPLTDEFLFKWLHAEFNHYGMRVNDGIVQYVLTHHRRCPAALSELVEVVAEVTLIQQRSVTIPFLKSCVERMATSSVALE